MTTKIDLSSLIVKNSQNWYWPKHDGNGDYEGYGSCWLGLNKHSDIPERVAAFADKHDVIVQAGGNSGFYVKKYANLFNFVYTFEPNPVMFYCLNLNVSEYNVFKYQACVGERHETVSIESTLMDIGGTHVAPGQSGIIPTIKIDDLALTTCDMIHLDTEGYELSGLKGAEETIKRCKPTVAIEYCGKWAIRYDVSLENIDEYLASLNYYLVCDLPNSQGERIYKFRT